MSNTSGIRRVVVTGIGAITPLGLSVSDTWKNALEGVSGIGAITHFDATECPVKFAGEVKGFDVTKPVGPFHPASDSTVTQACSEKDMKRFGRFTHLGLAASMEAYADSGLDAHRSQISPERMGVNIGVGMGGLPEIEAVHNDFLTRGFRRITPFFIPQVIGNMVSGQLSILLNLQGPNLCNLTACSSSAHAIGESFRQIQRGDADIMAASQRCVRFPPAMTNPRKLRAPSTQAGMDLSWAKARPL
jgi:3-oxoacyl-[acyl-carrier-protein] synthase II